MLRRSKLTLIAVAAIGVALFILADSVNALVNLPYAGNLFSFLSLIAVIAIFLIDRYEKRAEKAANIPSDVDKHHKTIVTEFDTRRLGNSVSGLSLIYEIRQFRFCTELVQHLFTGHRLIFDLMGSCLDQDKIARQADRDLTVYIRSLVSKEAKPLALESSEVSREYRYDDTAHRMLEEFAPTENEDFFAAELKNTAYVFSGMKNNRTQIAICRDIDQATKFANALNRLVHDAGVKDMIAKRNRQRENLGRVEKEFAGEFLKLINAIYSHAASLGGVCTACELLPRKENVSRMRADLHKLQKSDWLKEYLGD